MCPSVSPGHLSSLQGRRSVDFVLEAHQRRVHVRGPWGHLHPFRTEKGTLSPEQFHLVPGEEEWILTAEQVILLQGVWLVHQPEAQSTAGGRA